MTTKYFKNFNIVGYNFGNETSKVLFDDITQYVDIIDGLKDNVSFYEQFTIIAGDRPDTLSYRLYGTTDYYWTFFLMNDHLRESGWPIPTYDLLDTAKTKYPYRIITTNSDISTSFPVGQIITGVNSGTQGRIIKRNLDMGQLVVDTSVTAGDYFGLYPNLVNFSPTENIQYIAEDGAFYNATLVKESEQYNAVHHYEDADGVWQDLTLFDFANPSSQYTAITHRDRIEKRNDVLKQINVLKPDVIDEVVGEFNNFHKKVG